MKTTKSTRILSLLLCSLLLTASCGDSNTTPGGDTTDSGDNGTTDTQELELPDGLPQKDYGNESFVIATETNMNWHMIQEEESGDVLNDSIFKRNLAVEERFGVKLETVHDVWNVIGPKVLASIQSGDDEYSLCALHVINTSTYVSQGMFRNWYDVDYVDFSKPWWSQATSTDMTVNGSCYLAIGDFALSALERERAVFYNKSLAEDYKLPNLYELVNDGKWTQDKVEELTKDVYQDINANNERDAGDLYGWCELSRGGIDSYLWAFGNKIIDKNSAGELELVYHNEKTSAIFDRVKDFFDKHSGSYLYQFDGDWTVLNSHFREGRALFITATVNAAIGDFRDMNEDFGIIPLPKYDENQDRYYTPVDGGHDVLCVPVTVKDVERTGIITEALCAESYKKVVPSYYDVALKVKGARDEESVAMLDLVTNSRIFDIGFVYGGWSSAGFIYHTLIEDDTRSFESYWASNASRIEASYDEIFTFMSEN